MCHPWLQPHTNTTLPKPTPFSREEITAILAHVGGSRPNSDAALRDKALIVMLYRGCMRISATLRIMPADIDWAHQLVRVYKDKGGRSRTVPLDAKAMSILRQWSRCRDLMGLTDDSPFFCRIRNLGAPIDRKDVLRKFHTVCRAAGITRRVTLHLLRHTGASEMLAEGIPVATISRVLGHRQLATTYIYLHEICPELMDPQLTKREW